MEEQSVASLGSRTNNLIRSCLFVGLLITRHANSQLDTNDDSNVFEMSL
jgi:hypothetical protein